MPQPSPYQQCVQSFIDRQFADSAQQALALMQNDGLDLERAQLFLISAQRLNRTDLVEQFAPQILELTEENAWDHNLIRLTLGLVGPQEVLDQAETEHQVCQVFFYTGMRMLVDGEEELARGLFARCLEAKNNYLERLLAQVECSSATPAQSAGADADPQQTVLALNRKAIQLWEQDQQEQALALVRQALQVAETQLGPETIDVARCLNNLGAFLREQGKLAEARPCLERAARVCEKVEGPEHLHTAACLHSLGKLLRDLGDLPGACRCRERAFQIEEKHPEVEEADRASTLYELGQMHRDMKDFAGARPYFEHSLKINERLLGTEHRITAACYSTLGALLQAMGDFSGARLNYERALAICEKVLGPEHLETALVLDNLAELLQARGDLAGAKSYFVRALRIREKGSGPEHPATAASLCAMGVLLKDMGDLAGAQSYLEQALHIREKTLGPEHAETEKTLAILGDVLQAKGDHTAAQANQDRLMEVREASVMKAMLEAAGSAQTFRHVLGELNKSVSAPAPSHPEDDLAALRKQVSQLFHGSRFQEATELARQALQIAEAQLGAESRETASCLDDLGLLLQKTGDHSAARSCFERALGICQKTLGPTHPRTAITMRNLGSLQEALGEYAAAQSSFERALEIIEQALGLEDLQTARCLTGLAGVLSTRSDFSGARLHYERALSIYQKVLGPEHLETAATLDNLGFLFRERGDVFSARSYTERALGIFEKIQPRGPDTAACLCNLGGVLEAIGDLSGAKSCFERALSIYEEVYGPNHPAVATGCNNLGCALLHLDNTREARSYFERALRIREKALGEQHPDTARSLSNLASVAFRAGDHREALQYSERALTISTSVFGRDHPETANYHGNLGVQQMALGDHSGALSHLNQAFEVFQKVLGPRHHQTAATLTQLAICSAALDRDEQALDIMQKVAAIDDYLIGHIFSITSERERLSFLKSIESHTDIFLSLTLAAPGIQPKAVHAAVDLVLRRKAVTMEALAAQRDAALGGKYPALGASLSQWAQLRQKIALKSLSAPGAEGLEAREKQLAEWTQEKDALERQLAQQIPEMNLTSQLKRAERRAVALALDPGNALVEFARFNPIRFKAVPARGEQVVQPARYVAFVLRAGLPDEVTMIDLGPAEPIDHLIADFRSSITGDGAARDLGQTADVSGKQGAVSRERTGAQLRATLVAPLEPALRGYQKLLLAPDGALARLPFEVLPSEDGVLLIDRYQISYLGAGRDVLRFGVKTSEQPTESLVVADPEFDLDSAKARKQAAAPSGQGGLPQAPGRQSRDLIRGKYHFDRLPGTREEGERIAAMLGVQAWMKDAALEGRLKKQCRSPHILHFATHGFFLQDQPRDPNKDRRDLGFIPDANEGPPTGPLPENPLLRAGLALAGANTWQRQGAVPPEAEDGLLTAEDVSGLDLLATELVVLSACETGLGEVRTGEGVFGLQRAFVLAGAKTLVMSLWSVPDQQTRELMEDFYKRILSGQPRADALRAAQLVLRMKYPDPYFWGAFICQGDPGPLRQK